MVSAGPIFDGELIRLDEAKRLDRYFNHDISVIVDRVKIKKTGGRITSINRGSS